MGRLPRGETEDCYGEDVRMRDFTREEWDAIATALVYASDLEWKDYDYKAFVRGLFTEIDEMLMEWDGK